MVETQVVGLVWVQMVMRIAHAGHEVLQTQSRVLERFHVANVQQFQRRRVTTHNQQSFLIACPRWFNSLCRIFLSVGSVIVFFFFERIPPVANKCWPELEAVGGPTTCHPKGPSSAFTESLPRITRTRPPRTHTPYRLIGLRRANLLIGPVITDYSSLCLYQ